MATSPIISYLSALPTRDVAVGLKIQQIVFTFGVFFPDEKFTVKKYTYIKRYIFKEAEEAEEQESATEVGSWWGSSHLNCGVTLTL